jgi:acyl-CoA dehydrogenase
MEADRTLATVLAWETLGMRGTCSSRFMLEFQSSIALTKAEASEHAVAIVPAALHATGLTGYRKDRQFTIGQFTIWRYLRDILSSPLIISNERIFANAGATSLMAAVPAGWREHQA